MSNLLFDIFQRPLRQWLKHTALLFFFFFFGITPAQAAEENFKTSLETTYTVFETGTTRIQHEFEITNLKPLFTVSQYALKISAPDIEQVNVTSNDQELNPEVVHADTTTSIGITFPDEVVGQGKKRTFTISYTHPHAAVISGRVLEVAVPRIQDSTEYADYAVNLVTPFEYGLPSRATPEKYDTSITGTTIKTTFTENHQNGINVIFGTEQIFDLNLRYHLENPNASARLTQIALPPDTSFQKMLYTNLDPPPEKIERDQDGNWIATYRLPSNSTTTINASAQALLTLEPNPEVPVTPPHNKTTAADEYWQINAEPVSQTATQLTSPLEIYDFVTGTLSYNYDLLETEIIRYGADNALLNPDQALCQEFTDVFISLARANDIPARRLTGYAYTENSVLRPLSFVEDVLHAWPEYYNPETNLWIPIDPTWGHTSGGVNYFDQLDLNHIVFAINGADSERPYPAGSYKTAEETKDVEVDFGSTFILPEPQATLTVKEKKIGWLPLPQPSEIVLTNNTGAAFYNQEINLTPQDSSISLWPDSIIEVPVSLPYTASTYQVIALSDATWYPKQTPLQIHYGSINETINITVFPSYWRWFFNPFTLLGVVGGIVLLTLITGSLLVFGRRWAGTLRRQSQAS